MIKADLANVLIGVYFTIPSIAFLQCFCPFLADQVKKLISGGDT